MPKTQGFFSQFIKNPSLIHHDHDYFLSDAATGLHKKSTLTTAAVTLLGQGIGLATTISSNLIRCIAFPDPDKNEEVNDLGDLTRYRTTIKIEGAKKNDVAEQFHLIVTGRGTYEKFEQIDFVHSTYAWVVKKYVQKVMQIRLYIENGAIKSQKLSGDGRATSGDLELGMAGAPLVDWNVYFSSKGWTLTSGTVGWNSEDGASATLSFDNDKTELMCSAGIGAGFAIVVVQVATPQPYF